MNATNDDCKESFKVKITHKSGDQFVIGDEFGNYHQASFAIDMNVSVVAAKNVYPEIIDLLKPFRQIQDKIPKRIDLFDSIVKGLSLEKNVDATITLENRIDTLQHKLESLKYHHNECIKCEKEYEQKYKDSYINSIVELEEIEPVFEYETEAFLFQTKSALDILGQIIGLIYRLSGVVTYHNSGDDLIEKIQKTSALRECQDYKNEIIGILIKNRDWVQRLKLMRDLITHYSDLLGSHSITHKAAFEKDEYAIVCYPSMPDNQRVVTFMYNTWSDLMKLLADVGKNIFNLRCKTNLNEEG